MKILEVHKHLYRRDGAAAYVLDVSRLLIRGGNEVMRWGTREHLARVPDGYGIVPHDLLVNELHFDRREGFVRDMVKAGHYVWSREAARKFRAVLARFRPDLIHIHNIYHHLTPSILHAAHAHGVPVVMNVHDWKRINMNYALFDHGKICERHGLAALTHRCIQDSFTATALALVERGVHAALRSYEQSVRAYVVPTPFAAHLFHKAGIPSKLIHTMPYPVALPHRPNSALRAPTEEFILYAGRLSPEKGVNILIEAAAQLPHIPVMIAGAGPAERTLRTEAIVRNACNITFVGFQERGALMHLMNRARLVVVPSIWYDVSPFAVLEAQALGKAVIGSRIGGIVDLIKDGHTGFLVPPGNAHALAAKINALVAHPRALEAIGEHARASIAAHHDGAKHYAALMALFRTVAAQ